MRVNLHDVLLWLASVALALLLWFAVAGQKSAEVSVAAPIELRNVPSNLEVVGGAPRAVEVWLRGSPGMVQRLRPNEVYAPVDLSDAGPGTKVVHLADNEIRVPYGVRIASLRPASFVLKLERSTRRRLPIRAVLAGQPAAGFRVAGITTDPAEITVAGPESRVAGLESVSTEPVGVDQAQMSLTREVSLAPAAAIRIVDPRPVRVDVRIEREAEVPK